MFKKILLLSSFVFLGSASIELQDNSNNDKNHIEKENSEPFFTVLNGKKFNSIKNILKAGVYTPDDLYTFDLKPVKVRSPFYYMHEDEKSKYDIWGDFCSRHNGYLLAGCEMGLMLWGFNLFKRTTLQDCCAVFTVLEEMLKFCDNDYLGLLESKKFKELFFKMEDSFENTVKELTNDTKTILAYANGLFEFRSNIINPIFPNEKLSIDDFIKDEELNIEKNQDIFKTCESRKNAYGDFLVRISKAYPLHGTLETCERIFHDSFKKIDGMKSIIEKDLDHLIYDKDFKKELRSLDKSFEEFCDNIEGFVSQIVEALSLAKAIKKEFPAPLFEKEEKQETNTEN